MCNSRAMTFTSATMTCTVRHPHGYQRDDDVQHTSVQLQHIADHLQRCTAEATRKVADLQQSMHERATLRR